MAERRYGIRFGFFGGVVLLASALFASFAIFVSGVYVGREVAASKAAQQAQAVRVPINVPEEPSVASRPTANAPLTWQLPKETSAGSALTLKVETATTGKKEKPDSSASRPPSPGASSSPMNATIMGNRTLSSLRSNGEGTAKSSPAARAEKPDVSSPPPASAAANPDGQSSPDVKPPEAKLDTSTMQKPAGRAKRWKVQVEATTQETAAQDIAKTLREQGYNPSISKVVKQGEVWYRVRVGKFTSQEEANMAIARFRREGKFSQAYPVSE